MYFLRQLNDLRLVLGLNWEWGLVPLINNTTTLSRLLNNPWSFIFNRQHSNLRLSFINFLFWILFCTLFYTFAFGWTSLNLINLRVVNVFDFWAEAYVGFAFVEDTLFFFTPWFSPTVDFRTHAVIWGIAVPFLINRIVKKTMNVSTDTASIGLISASGRFLL